MRPERWGGTWQAAVVAAFAGLLAAACSGPATSLHFAAPPSSAAAAPSTAAPPLAPLTGLPTQPSIAARPAVALAIAGSQPEGLSDADIIYEEVASPLRYVAIFQSRQAKMVGPITGTEPADGQEVAVLRPLIGYDGGTASFIQVLDHTGVVDLGAGTHGSLYQYSADGPSTSTQALWAAAQSAAPPALLAYRGSQTGSQALATTGESRPSSVTVQLPGYGTQKWIFDARADLWRQVSGGPPIAVANLIIQTVSYKDVFLSRREGLTEPSAKVIGRGSVEAFSGIADSSARGPGGLAAQGEWSKPGLREVTNYVDGEGLPMHFQPGPTWVILAPDGTRVQMAGATP